LATAEPHLAGAQAAVEIMDHIEASHGNTRARGVVRQSRPDVLADRDELERMADAVGGRRSAIRTAAGWLSEKMVELNLKLDDPADGALRLLESVELLALGTDGKLALWHALDASQAHTPENAPPDYVRLIERAQSQRARGEDVRTEAASAAFSGPRSSSGAPSA
jgi:hypothetical protein